MRVVILFLLSISLSGCSAVLGLVLGIKAPKEESKQKQVTYLNKYRIDTLNLYQLRDAYLDTLKQGGHVLETVEMGFSPIQFRVYETKTGKTVSGWASCDGSAERLKLYEAFPPNGTPRLNRSLTLSADLAMVETFEGQFLHADELSHSHDYVIIAFWASYLGSINRNMLLALDTYVQQHADKKVLLIKVNLGNS